MITLKKKQMDEINNQAENEYPYECCGLLIGNFEADKSKSVQHIVPISNARAEEDKHNRFLITPEKMMRGELFARKNKMDVLGFYHSHPDHPAAPSEYDLEYAWPLYSYIIVSVKKGKADKFTSWQLEIDRSKFNAESIMKGD